MEINPRTEGSVTILDLRGNLTIGSGEEELGEVIAQLLGEGRKHLLLNLADVPPGYARRIITSWWFRFRRAIENTPTALVVVTPVACIRSCAAMVLEVKNEGPLWPNTKPFVLENSDARLTIKEDGKQTTHFSLITKSTRPSNSCPQLTHSHLLRGIRVRVNRERPLTWTAGPARFKTRLH